MTQKQLERIVEENREVISTANKVLGEKTTVCEDISAHDLAEYLVAVGNSLNVMRPEKPIPDGVVYRHLRKCKSCKEIADCALGLYREEIEGSYK